MEKSTHTHEYAALRAELLKNREKAGLTQRALAALLDVPHSWVAKVEQGERRVDLIEFARYVAACGADPIEAAVRVLKRPAASGTKRPRSAERSR